MPFSILELLGLKKKNRPAPNEEQIAQQHKPLEFEGDSIGGDSDGE